VRFLVRQLRVFGQGLISTVCISSYRNLVIAPFVISATLHFRPSSCLQISQGRWVPVVSGYSEHMLCEGVLGMTFTVSGSVCNAGRSPVTLELFNLEQTVAFGPNLLHYLLCLWSDNAAYMIFFVSS